MTRTVEPMSSAVINGARGATVETAAIAVVVVQQQRVLREAVQLRLDAEPDFEVVSSVATVGEAGPAISANPCAVVVLDEPNANESCHSLMAELRAASPLVRAVMLLGSTDLGIVSAAVTAGIAGVLCSDTPTTSLVQAVRTVAGGVCVLDEHALRQLAGTWQPVSQPMLSGREREVLTLLAAGSSNSEIASQLYVSTETIKTHVAHVLRKLEVTNRGSAVEKANRLGLLV
jgi:DNA-binding NarL/FixJ family response regulator